MIGAGSYGKVFAMGGQSVRKEIAFEPEDYRTAIVELAIARRLKGARGCMQLVGYKVTDGLMYLYFPQCDSDMRRRRVTDYLSYLFGMLTAVYEMHKRNVLHLDIKPDNLFASRSKILIGDYGMCAVGRIGTCVAGLGKRGASGFEAPEVCEKSQNLWSSKADVWAVAACFVDALLGQDFTRRRDVSNLAGDVDAEIRTMVFDGVWTKREMRSLMKGMLAGNPGDRLDVHDALNHPLFSDFRGVRFKSPHHMLLIKGERMELDSSDWLVEGLEGERLKMWHHSVAKMRDDKNRLRWFNAFMLLDSFVRTSLQGRGKSMSKTKLGRVHLACLVIVDAVWGCFETLFYWSAQGDKRERLSPRALLQVVVEVIEELDGDVCPISPSEMGISLHVGMSMLVAVETK
jgi:serine/threonine protein kinase